MATSSGRSVAVSSAAYGSAAFGPEVLYFLSRLSYGFSGASSSSSSEGMSRLRSRFVGSVGWWTERDAGHKGKREVEMKLSKEKKVVNVKWSEK